MPKNTIATQSSDTSSRATVVAPAQVGNAAPEIDSQINAFDEILKRFEDNTKTKRDKGTAFELLVRAVLSKAQPWCEQFSQVQTYAKWAKDHPDLTGGDARDTGVDLVATNAYGDAPTYTAIQCKFFGRNHTIPKSQVDSFVSSLTRKAPDGRPLFQGGIFVHTGRLTENAQNLLVQCNLPIRTLSRSELEDANVDWLEYLKQGKLNLLHLQPRPYQQEAITAVLNGFKTHSRGQLIMACGTGKTFTALQIAEKLMSNKSDAVIYLVPSLALLNQTLLEWKRNASKPFLAYAVCSDSKAGQKSGDDDFASYLRPAELQYPASTDANALIKQVYADLGRLMASDQAQMMVFFSTYQSLQVLHDAFGKLSFIHVKLIICDEAHRTAGSRGITEEERLFTLVHDDNYIDGSKRLYMTATPKVYGEAVKEQEKAGEAVVYSMDDESKFGPVFYTISFNRALQLGCLVDYKVLVLACDQQLLPQQLAQTLYLSQGNAAKMIGAWKCINKFGVAEDLSDDPQPMSRVIGFAQVISTDKPERVGSKQFTSYFQGVIEAYRNHITAQNAGAAIASEEFTYVLEHDLVCECRHIDGSMNALQKAELLDWLRAEPEENHCKILFNVRCLGEGVNVPALDGVIFFSSRKSMIDIVQIVGRVMRVAPGKVRGYIMIPVVVGNAENPEAILENSEFKELLQVLNAIKAINPDVQLFDQMLGKLDDHIEVIRVVDEKVQPRTPSHGAKGAEPVVGVQGSLVANLDFGLAEMIRAALIKKLGSRKDWRDWAEDVATFCTKQVGAIKQTLAQDSNALLKGEFDRFCQELNESMSQSFTIDEIIEMLAQHIVIKPVLDELFRGFPFTEHNAISGAMSAMLERLEQGGLSKVNTDLQGFYDSVATRMKNVVTLEERQKVIVELFDRFFKVAFPKLQEKLGIVYTPIEVVDFINHSVNDLLKREFNTCLGSSDVHILDPFTGTGTFITRMMQCPELISKEQLAHKYQQELHAFEIVPLAYYVASINIESVFHEQMGLDAAHYEPNSIMVLTDTFADYSDEILNLRGLLGDNAQRRAQVQNLPLKVIVGNPPYSVGQESQNDDNQNERYPALEQRIAETYVAQAGAVSNRNSLYDSYIKAFRWASDRLGEKGVIAFVTNAGWIDSEAARGMRRCLQQEFSAVYVYHLKGNQRTSGEQSRKEGGKIFGSGSRAPIAITVLVKNPEAQTKGKIYFATVDDYLSREEKLGKLSQLGSIAQVNFAEIEPDSYGDWINQRRDDFAHFITVDGKKTDSQAIFDNYSVGIKTNRDAWAFNSSKERLERNFTSCIKLFNAQVASHKFAPASFVRENDPTKIKWSRSLENTMKRGISSPQFAPDLVVTSLYRPFFKQFLYNEKTWLEMTYQIPQLFPFAGAENLVITLTGVGAQDFSCLMSAHIPCLDCLEKSQCFPRYLYRKVDELDGASGSGTLLETGARVIINGYERRDAIGPEAIAHFQEAYPQAGAAIDADAVFYYIYGILHSPDYRATYANNLQKELPRIPRVATYDDFKAFADAGRALAQLHVGYEQVKPYEGCTLTYAPGISEQNMDYSVTQLKYGRIKGKTGNDAKDKSTIIYNAQLTISNIPLAAQSYLVNKKSALDWAVERYGVTTDKASRINNNFNDYAAAMGDQAYILKLILRLITVSLETNKIVQAMPKLVLHQLDQ